MGQSNTKLEQFREYLGLNLVQNTPHFRASPFQSSPPGQSFQACGLPIWPVGPLVGKYWTLGQKEGPHKADTRNCSLRSVKVSQEVKTSILEIINAHVQPIPPSV